MRKIDIIRRHPNKPAALVATLAGTSRAYVYQVRSMPIRMRKERQGQKEPNRHTKAWDILHGQAGLSLNQVADKFCTTISYVHSLNERYADHPLARQFMAKRGPKGRLTDAEVRAIRRDFRPLHVIASEHNVSLSYICRVRALKERMDVV
jgi:transposase